MIKALEGLLQIGGIFPVVTSTTLGVSSVKKNSFSANAYSVPASSKMAIAFTGHDNATTTLSLTI